MKKTAIGALVVLSAAIGGTASQAGDLNLHSSSTAPIIGRYEIVQSTLLARDTYRLDKYLGRVHRMVASAADGKPIWGEMRVQDRPAVEEGQGPRFQLFLSGIAAAQTFLIDTATGATWQVREVSDDKVPPNKTTEWFLIDVYHFTE